MSNKTSIIYNVLISILTIGGVGLCIYLFNRGETNHRIIKFNGEEIKQEYSISLQDFYPGKSFDYRIQIEAEREIPHNISLNFKASKDISLADYVNLTVTFNDKEYTTNKFSDYFTKDLVSIPNTSKKSELILKYTMPVETGDAAQDAVADFTLEVNVRNEGF